MMIERAVKIGGPYFEELHVGDTLTAPAVTLTEGHVAVHQAIVGDRMPVFLSSHLSDQVFGGSRPAPPGLAVDLAIGQSTLFTRRVRANLFYRGLQLRRLPNVGDTLGTTTEVVALRQNRPRPDRPATGLAVLRIRTTDHYDRPVLDFERCAMLPLRDQQVQTGHGDDLGSSRRDIDAEDAVRLASEWNLDALRAAVPGPHARELAPGARFEVTEADPVTAATELARLTVNLAEVHYDPRVTGTGRRLVYGGHTIGLATHQCAKAIPALCAVIAWETCDHTAPVHEGDLLTSTVEVERVSPLPMGGALVTLHSVVHKHGEEQPVAVLDWRYLAAVA